MDLVALILFGIACLVWVFGRDKPWSTNIGLAIAFAGLACQFTQVADFVIHRTPSP